MTHATSNLNTWFAIAAAVLATSGGDVLLARAMKQIGDVGELRKQRGLLHVVFRAAGSHYFLLGVASIHEHVDARRWAAALLVAGGVVLMAL